jgi:hypothetical protein
MTTLDTLIAKAYASAGKMEDANKVYLTLLKTTLFVPVQKQNSKPPEDSAQNESEPFMPLFMHYENNFFMMIFDTMERLSQWSGEKKDTMDYVELAGKDVIRGLGEHVYLCLNYGTDYYKEFAPDEIKRLKAIISKIESLDS